MLLTVVGIHPSVAAKGIDAAAITKVAVAAAAVAIAGAKNRRQSLHAVTGSSCRLSEAA